MNRFKVFLRDKNKKSVFRIIKEVLILTYKKKEIPFYYFKYLYRRGVTNYLDYLSLKEQRTLQTHPKLHRQDLVTILDNKLEFALLAKGSNIKVPEVISYNLKSKFYFDSEISEIFELDELICFYEERFIASKLDSLFMRPIDGNSGVGCFKLYKDKVQQQLSNFGETILKSNYIASEVIKQHSDIDRIHPNCINTLRLVTLIKEDETTEIISAFMRFGVGNSDVDNASSGGFFAGININEGTLKKKGHFLPQFGGAEIYVHPDSGFPLQGFKIPYYKEACEAVLGAVKVIPDRLIGWDVAISIDGPLIIEANSQPHMQMSNIAHGGMLKNKAVRDVLKKLS
ncbi:MAG: hypothetical protein HRU49_12055 [Winogradskyella sp.]|uniref:sugar-transfer associated ATP-grasp domain-containing protein n=1 Tax=Winogradskyella sp. TaxID=1883156 RepID=UPI0025DEB72D|nr:sugar-transfer associated ATP-grasp domain-containing protein [Winogradskyella sp.]NRB84490.1 hypothetical protein [Winogradskyella sp.]